MAKISKTVVDACLRNFIFSDLDVTNRPGYEKINDRQYGTIILDANGVERYCRIGVIVAEEREDKTARELMAEEQKEYAEKQAKAQAKAEERARKAEADKARRQAKAKEKAEE